MRFLLAAGIFVLQQGCADKQASGIRPPVRVVGSKQKDSSLSPDSILVATGRREMEADGVAAVEPRRSGPQMDAVLGELAAVLANRQEEVDRAARQAATERQGDEDAE